VAAVSNADLMQALSAIQANQGRVEEKVDYAIKLAEKTNGRVTKIEDWKNALQAVDAYKRENKVATPQVQYAEQVNIQQKWFQNEKLVVAVAGLLIALSALVQYFTRGGAS